MEKWEEIFGYGNEKVRYEISNIGRIKAIYDNEKVKYLKVSDAFEYPTIRLQIYKGAKTQHIHRLVAIHFIPNPKFKSDVNHIDGNKKNYHYSNLEWVTRKENVLHSHKIGISRVGDNVSLSLFTNEQVNYIRDQYNNGITVRQISRSLGIKTNKLKLILNGY